MEEPKDPGLQAKHTTTKTTKRRWGHRALPTGFAPCQYQKNYPMISKNTMDPGAKSWLSDYLQAVKILGGTKETAMQSLQLHLTSAARSWLSKLEKDTIGSWECRWILCRENTGYHATDPKIQMQGAEHGRSWIATKHGDRSLESSNTQCTAERDAKLYPGSGPSW
jgi:hypothetical protein